MMFPAVSRTFRFFNCLFHKEEVIWRPIRVWVPSALKKFNNRAVDVWGRHSESQVGY